MLRVDFDSERRSMSRFQLIAPMSVIIIYVTRSCMSTSPRVSLNVYYVRTLKLVRALDIEQSHS